MAGPCVEVVACSLSRRHCPTRLRGLAPTLARRNPQATRLARVEADKVRLQLKQVHLELKQVQELQSTSR